MEGRLMVRRLNGVGLQLTRRRTRSDVVAEVLRGN